MQDNKKKTGSKKYCIAFGCLNTDKMPNISLFTLPKDVERQQQWLRALDRQDLLKRKDLKVKSHCVCSEHFDKSSFKFIKHLIPDAVPHIDFTTSSASFSSTNKMNIYTQTNESFLCNVPFENLTTVSHETQTEDQEIPERTNTHKRKLAIQQRNKFKRRRLVSGVRQVNEDLEENNRDAVLQNLKHEIGKRFKTFNDKFRGNRNDEKYKVLALNLYYSSPQTYRTLQSLLKLPSKASLYNLKLNIPSNLDDRVLKSISLKLKSLPVEARYCTICIEEIVLKRNLFYDIKTDEITGCHAVNGKPTHEIACSAYVAVLQGILIKWKTPLTYAFQTNKKTFCEVDNWLISTMEKLFKIGVAVKAIISKHGSNFDAYAKSRRRVVLNKPFFRFDCHKIFYIYDVSSLLKGIANDLMTRDFEINKDIISFKHIKAMYNDQKERNLGLIPQITIRHIEPGRSKQISVEHATQLFSRALHTALETYISFGNLPKDAIATARFVKMMNDLLDILNPSPVQCNRNSRTAFSMTEQQKTVLKNAQNVFAVIKPVKQSNERNNTKSIKSIEHFQITIQAIEQLSEDMKKNGYGFIFTERLNINNLDHLLEMISHQIGHEPKPYQFSRAFSKSFLINMLKGSTIATSEVDISEMLRKAEDILNSENTDNLILTIPDIPDVVNDYPEELPDKNALTYVAGYLIYKCAKKHRCNYFAEFLKTVPGLEETKLFTHCKVYNKFSSFYGNLQLPPDNFLAYIQSLENVFATEFEKYVHDSPAKHIIEKLKNTPTTLLCPCFPIDYFLNLFVRLRIFATLRLNNRQYNPGNRTVKYHLTIKKLGN